ncbi:alpha/beta fold hydrolase [Yinghuangia seranimata]|uniref:alpha/beta fold hydrolase n=1 Tax=Yinghuangia seranimata TaxID=408067 RepID=UPI00248D2969|nr:alpha/beta hydrolase [Yinghuangia seranimata]MDI2131015.1 alpha/beta hydrolase [Yinghuangia seranimata]
MTTTQAVSDATAAAWPARTVAVTGETTVTVRRHPAHDPELPPAVLVHGLGGSSLNWNHLADELRDVVAADCIDLPGFGFSPPPHDGDYSISAHCRAVEGLILTLGRGPVHLMGNSMGGAVATRVAARRPDLVRTLTLVSPALPDLKPQATALPTALMAVPGFATALGRFTRDLTPEQRTRLSVNLCFGHPELLSEREFAEFAAEYKRRLGLPYMVDAFTRSSRGVVTSYLERGPRSLWKQAAQVKAPTLLVYGRRDRLVDSRRARRAAATFPDARLVMVPESGHVAMMEHPRVVARAFRDLLDDVAEPSISPASAG